VAERVRDQALVVERVPSGAGRARRLDQLTTALLSADGLLVSGPVYFGDRGSLVQELIDFIRDDAELREGMRDKVYAGIAVGAKRNGGQETTLIYQLMDMVTLEFLGVGNDSDTTAQYGTGHAGDVGTMVGDEYGLWTSLGTGRRIARVATLAMLGKTSSLRDKVRIAFWILQDRDEIASRFVKELLTEWAHEVEATVIDVTGRNILRCIACDICPTHIAVDDEYRCVINGRQDELASLHGLLLNCDAIVPVAYSPADRRGLVSNYQRFIERTRYLRHADYGLGDCLTAPLVIEEVGVLQNMHIRMTTSLLRHHTVITEPMVTYMHQGQMLNAKETRARLGRFVRRTKLLTAGRLRAFVSENGHDVTYALSKYNATGYVLSAEKDKEDEELDARGVVVHDRQRRLAIDAGRRLATTPSVVGDCPQE
jgi:multimeric flavodoxin WrbA